MELATFNIPALLRKWGEQEVVLSFPSTLKVQTTGPGADTLLNQGPEAGKTWTVLVRVEVKET